MTNHRFTPYPEIELATLLGRPELVDDLNELYPGSLDLLLLFEAHSPFTLAFDDLSQTINFSFPVFS